MSDWFVPAGSAPAPYDVAVTPESVAGWRHTSLHVVVLDAGATQSVVGAGDERLVVPLAGGVDVSVTGGDRFHLTGRANVFAGPTDVLYVPTGSEITLSSATGGRFAVCGARTDLVLPARLLSAADVAVERRGAGRSSRLVRNFGSTEALAAGAIIACEVITPGGNWSSYPAHKHDVEGPHESVLEEIYYFEVSGEQGFGFHRTSSSEAGEIDVLAEVRQGDVALVPYGWHGPCAAAPGHDLYYLNVMAGPGERAWLITDHPDQAWVRSAWEREEIDPRLEGMG